MTRQPVPTRDTDRRVVAGVCAGLARQWRVDPILVRAGAIVLTLATNGLGLLLYLAAWLVCPADTHGSRRRTQHAPVLALLLVLSALGGLQLTGSSGAASGLGMLAVLAVAWYGVWFTAQRSAGPVVRSTPPSAPSAPGGEFGGPGGPTWRQPPAAEARLAGAHRVGDPAPRRAERRSVGIVVLALWTAVAVADVASLDIPPVVYPALALLVIGGTLVGRALRRPAAPRVRGLIPLGLVLSLVTLAFAAPGASEVRPEQRLAFATAADLPREPVALGTGEHILDLRHLRLDADATLTVTGDAGRVHVLLPARSDVAVTARYRVGMGVLDVAGQRFDGLDTDHTAVDPATPGVHRLTLDVALDMGELEVAR